MKAEYLSHMGSDLTVVNSARVSFDKESEGIKGELVYMSDGGFEQEYSLTDKDKGLIKYLATHGHWTPFSHPQITMRYTVPIFVARQEFKHIVGFTRNEVSRRYVDDPPEFFVPTSWRSRPEGSVKQGSGTGFTGYVRTEENSGVDMLMDEVYQETVEYCFETYRLAIEAGIAPEQARMVLPQSMYTSYWITGSLAAFARFVKQRSDPHAQVEIQDLATMVDQVIRPLYPVSWEALVNTDDA